MCSSNFFFFRGGAARCCDLSFVQEAPYEAGCPSFTSVYILATCVCELVLFSPLFFFFSSSLSFPFFYYGGASRVLHITTSLILVFVSLFSLSIFSFALISIFAALLLGGTPSSKMLIGNLHK